MQDIFSCSRKRDRLRCYEEFLKELFYENGVLR